MRRTKTIKIPLYYQKLKIVVDDILDKNEHEAYVEYEESTSTIILQIRPNATPGVIAREALHITHHVYIECAITLELYNDEPQAYLLGWLVEEITKFVNLK